MTDKEKRDKKIIADYMLCRNYSEVARKYGLASSNTVKNIVMRDPATAKACEQKSKEATQSVLDYIDTLSDLKKEILLDVLKAIKKKAKKPDMFTSIKDYASTYGILLDKELKVLESKQESTTEPITIILERRNKDD